MTIILPMKTLASTRYARTTMRGDDSLGQGMDAAFTLAAFTGLGFLLDRWIGTTPLFMIACFVVAAVGIFLAWKARYTSTMERHEADRAARASAHRTGAAAATITTASTSTGTQR